MNRAIITSCSNKFFPSVLNLIGSVKQNYTNAPQIYVFDLGLLGCFKWVLKRIEGVSVVDVPRFAPYWRSCYTWKTYILAHPLSKLNLYMDAGCEVLQSLDEIFDVIDGNGCYFVKQKVDLETITPAEYRSLFVISDDYYCKDCITAGIVGFKNDSFVMKVMNELYDCAKIGLCLGFSQIDKHRNTGLNKTKFVRNCRLFRHDTTLLSLLCRKYFGEQFDNDISDDGTKVLSKNRDQYIINNLRLNFFDLQYAKSKNWISRSSRFSTFTLFIIDLYLILFFLLKKGNLFLKKHLGFKGLYTGKK